MTRALPLLLLGVAAVVVPLMLWHQNQGLRAENAALRATIKGAQDAQQALEDVRRDGRSEWMHRTFDGGAGRGNP